MVGVSAPALAGAGSGDQSLVGLPMPEQGPLTYWLGALSIRLFGWLLGRSPTYPGARALAVACALFVPAYTAAVARAERASERMRSTIERKPLERCGVRCSRKPNRSNSATASVARMSLAALSE